MNVGIAIDPWKFSIFKKHLKGWNYRKTTGRDTITLTVITDDLDGLTVAIESARAECARLKAH